MIDRQNVGGTNQAAQVKGSVNDFVKQCLFCEKFPTQRYRLQT